MILTCEKCDTRFRLDASRLPAKGARVRCSRCKHAFFVRAPGVSSAEAIDAVASEAAHTAAPERPEVAWDLDESADPGSTLQRAARSAAAVEPPRERDQHDDESDWRFEDEMPELGDSGASLDLPNGEAPALSAEPDANESSFAQLGDPESWDLLSSSQPELPALAPPPPAAEPIAAPAPRAERAAPAASEARTQPARRAAPPEQPAVEARRIVPIEVSPRAQLAGLAALALLVALVSAGGLRGAPGAVAEPAAQALGPLAVEKLHARLVDNVWTGPVWVVSGELHNPTRQAQRLDAALGVVLLDGAGRRIEGALAIAQPALDASRLRQEDPAALHEQGSIAAAALGRRALEPDARVAFDAVFRAAPRTARRFALDEQPLPPAPPPAPGLEAAPPGDPTTPAS